MLLGPGPCCFGRYQRLEPTAAGDPVPRGPLELALPAVLGGAGLAVGGDGGAAAGSAPLSGDPATGDPATGDPAAGDPAGAWGRRGVRCLGWLFAHLEEGCASGADRAGACVADDGTPSEMCATGQGDDEEPIPRRLLRFIDDSRRVPLHRVQRYHTRHARTRAG